MPKIGAVISEADLASENPDRWAAAMCKCTGGNPESCMSARACIYGNCFDDPIPKDPESLKREIEHLMRRNDELSIAINQFSALLDSHVMGYQSMYERMVKQGKQDSAFIYRSVMNDTKEFKQLIDQVYKP